MPQEPNLFRKLFTKKLYLNNTLITATADEINAMAGAGLDATEVGYLDGVTAGTATASKALVVGANKNVDTLVIAASGLKIGAGAGTAVTATATELSILAGVTATAANLNKVAGLSTDAYPVVAAEVTFTETTGAGVWTGAVVVPAGGTIHDIIINGVALWNSQTSATLKVGDTDDDGFYVGVDLMATDLLAGESLSFSMAGGKAGAYIANSQVSPRYSATSRTINGIITKVGSSGTAGRTRMTVIYSVPGTQTAATKV